jgi:glycosyltransferase involved in cell wall biosynthesis
MSETALIGVAILLAAPALWPFGPYQVTLILARHMYRFPAAIDRQGSGASNETFAICLCVYNEAAVIRDKVEDLLRLRRANDGQLDICIYVDAATDGTTESLSGYRDQVRLVVSPQRRGKTHGMNLLVAGTAASIVMFTDANVRIDPSAIAVLKHYFANPEIGCVCSYLTYVNAGDSAAASVGTAFWSFNEWSKGLETATGSVIGADGSLFAIRREYHRPVPDGLFDDIYVSLSVLFAGSRVVRAPELRAYETHSTRAVDEFRRKIRISCECMAVHFKLWPELRQMGAWNLYKYLGHRLMRWVGGYLLLASAIVMISAAVLAFGGVTTTLVISVLIVLYAAVVRLNLRFASATWNVILAFTGNAIGTWKAFRGMRAVTWEPPSSAREAQLDMKAGALSGEGRDSR